MLGEVASNGAGGGLNDFHQLAGDMNIGSGSTSQRDKTSSGSTTSGSSHQDRPNMTLEEYFAFAGAEAERPYFEFMELEILDSLQEGNGLRIEEEDLDSLPKEYVNIRIYRADRDRLAARMRYGETMAEKIHTLIERVASEDQP